MINGDYHSGTIGTIRFVWGGWAHLFYAIINSFGHLWISTLPEGKRYSLRNLHTFLRDSCDPPSVYS